MRSVAGVQLRAMWFSIQLVSVVASVMTNSTCDVMKFNWVKSESGDVLCATAPSPTVSVSMQTRKDCSYECAHNSVTCAAGFNYKHDETLCELFANTPTTLQVQQNCVYYAVCTFLKYLSLLYLWCCILLSLAKWSCNLYCGILRTLVLTSHSTVQITVDCENARNYECFMKQYRHYVYFPFCFGRL